MSKQADVHIHICLLHLFLWKVYLMTHLEFMHLKLLEADSFVCAVPVTGMEHLIN